MNPSEHFSSSPLESQPTPASEAESMFDTGKEYNGMYDSAEDFQAAESLYKIPPVDVFAGVEMTSYEVATTETEPETNYAVAEVPSPQVPKTETFPTNTEMTTSNLTDDENVIDVEMRELTVDPDSLDETEDLTSVIEDNQFINIGNQRLDLTPHLKSLTKGIFSSIDRILTTPESNVPDQIDWQSFIMAEPDYDETYDYALLAKLLDTQYRRRRAAKLSELYIRNAQAEQLRMPNIPIPAEEVATTNQAEENPNITPLIELNDLTPAPEDEALTIEYNPSVSEVPALENAIPPLAIGYEPPPTTEASTPVPTEPPAISNKT